MPGNSAQLVYLFRACFLKVCCICCLLPQTAFHARPCLVGVYFKLLNVSLLKGEVVVHQSDLERWKIERIFFFGIVEENPLLPIKDNSRVSFYFEKLIFC